MATFHEDDQGFLGVLSKEDGFGGSLNIKVATVEHECDGEAITETITGIVPARARVIGVSGRVVEVLAGASLGTISVGDGTDADLYGSGLAKTEGTTFGSHTATANPFTHAFSTSAGNIVLTGSAGVFESGKVRVSVFYIDTTPSQR